MAAAMWAVAMLVALAEATAWGAVHWAAFVAAPLAAAAAKLVASTARALLEEATALSRERRPRTQHPPWIAAER